MALKSAIRKAITENTNFSVVKVWDHDIDGPNWDGTFNMVIEITLRKKKRRKKQ